MKQEGGQSNLKKGRIAAAHVPFNRIRQVTPMYTPCNIYFFAPIRVHDPNGISIGSAVFCTAHRRASLYFTMGCPCPLKITRSHGGSRPYLIRCILCPPKATTQTASDRFNRFYRVHDSGRPTDRHTTLLGL